MQRVSWQPPIIGIECFLWLRLCGNNLETAVQNQAERSK